jgi:hypothetical protein
MPTCRSLFVGKGRIERLPIAAPMEHRALLRAPLMVRSACRQQN